MKDEQKRAETEEGRRLLEEINSNRTRRFNRDSLSQIENFTPCVSFSDSAQYK